jgi:hypothetical protein
VGSVTAGSGRSASTLRSVQVPGSLDHFGMREIDCRLEKTLDNLEHVTTSEYLGIGTVDVLGGLLGKRLPCYSASGATGSQSKLLSRGQFSISPGQPA